MSEGDGVDERVGERQLVLDEQIGSRNGDSLIDGDDEARAHGLGHFVGFGRCALLKGNLADFRKDDAGDDEIGQLEENGAEVNGVGTIFEAFEPSTGIENVGIHEREDEGSGLEFAIRISLKFKRLISFQVPDELLGHKDGTKLDVAVFFNHVEALAGLEVERFTNFLWDNDLVFRGQK